MSQEVLIVLAIAAVCLGIALIKELFSMLARGIIAFIQQVIMWVATAVWCLLGIIVKIVIAPFAFLWGYITSR